jgi:hypothetical protein
MTAGHCPRWQLCLIAFAFALTRVDSAFAERTYAQATTAAQDESPERLILSRSVAAIQKVHPEWELVPVICSSCPPLMDEQVGQVNGTWRRTTPDQSMIAVAIHRIRTADVAGRWLDRQISTVPPGWKVQPYKFGDGATMTTYPDPRGSRSTT